MRAGDHLCNGLVNLYGVGSEGGIWGKRGRHGGVLFVVAWVSKARMVQVRTDMMHDHCIRLCTDPAGVAFAGPGRPEYNTSP